MFNLKEENDIQGQQLTDQYPEGFREELGTIKGVKAHIQVPEGIFKLDHWPAHYKNQWSRKLSDYKQLVQ